MFFANNYLLTKKIYQKIKTFGFRYALSRLFHKLSLAFAVEPVQQEDYKDVDISTKQIVPGHFTSFDELIFESLKYDPLSNKPTKNSHEDKNKKYTLEFAWLIPFFSQGSGGHKNLFRFLKFVESFGCKCTVYIVGDYDIFLTPEDIRKQICEYFEDVKADVKIYNPKANYDKVDVVVCTSWITAYAGRTINADLKVYFVQDYESLFYSAGSYSFLAQNTYSFGYYHITLGKWLTQTLRQKHGVEADYYNIVVEKDVYYHRQVIKNPTIKSLQNNDTLKICFYGRSVTPRRCFELVSMALQLFSERAENITLISYGWNEIPAVPFKCYNLGMLSVEELAELYSVCDVCIAPSSTNLSLVANEVMACGCALMDLDVDSTVHDLIHLENCYLVKPDPQSMADGLLHLYSDRKLLADLKRKSLQHVSNLSDWSSQGTRFYQLIKTKLEERSQLKSEVSSNY